MGYTVLPATDLIGVGVTSIGDVGGCYVQNEKNLSRYRRSVDEGSCRSSAASPGAPRTSCAAP